MDGGGNGTDEEGEGSSPSAHSGEHEHDGDLDFLPTSAGTTATRTARSHSTSFATHSTTWNSGAGFTYGHTGSANLLSMRDRSSAQQRQGRPSCAHCQIVKRRCEFADADSAACNRCIRLKRVCSPPEEGVSRRKREKLRRQERQTMNMGMGMVAPPGQHQHRVTSDPPPSSAPYGQYGYTTTATANYGAGVSGPLFAPPPPPSALVTLTEAASAQPHAKTITPTTDIATRPSQQQPPPPPPQQPHQQQPISSPVLSPSSNTSAEIGATTKLFDPLINAAVAASFTTGGPNAFNEIVYPYPPTTTTTTPNNIFTFTSPFNFGPTPPNSLAPSNGPAPPRLAKPPTLMISWPCAIPSDTFRMAVDTYWSRLYPIQPFLHRATFERAFVKPSGLYGVYPPLCLLHGIAATGARMLPLPMSERNNFARACAERCRDLLLSGYFGRSTPPISDLEAVQAMGILVHLLVPAGIPQSTVPLLEKTVNILKPRYKRIARKATQMPGSADDWIEREMIVRIRTGLMALDLGLALHSGRPAVCDYFQPEESSAGSYSRAPLSCRDDLFDDPDPDAVFRGLVTAPNERDRALLYPTVELPLAQDRVSAERFATDLVHQVFSRRSGVLTLFYHSHYIRHLIVKFNGEDEELAAILAASNAPLNAFPLPTKQAFELGNPDPVLHNLSSVFTHQAHPHTALTFILCTYTDTTLVLPETAQQVSSALCFAQHIDHRIKTTAGGWAQAHYIFMAAAWRNGSLLIDAFKAATSEEEKAKMGWGARILGKWLGMIGESYGMMARKVSKQFDEELDRAQVPVLLVDAMKVVEVEEEEPIAVNDIVGEQDGKGGEMGGWFADTLLEKGDVNVGVGVGRVARRDGEIRVS